MQARTTTGMSEDDVKNVKVYMRTFKDAIDCARDIADRESARTQYKHYVKMMLKKGGPHIVLDKDNNVVAARDNSLYRVFR